VPPDYSEYSITGPPTERERWPMELMPTFAGGLRPCVTVTIVPTTTHPMSPTVLNHFQGGNIFLRVGIPRSASIITSALNAFFQKFMLQRNKFNVLVAYYETNEICKVA